LLRKGGVHTYLQKKIIPLNNKFLKISLCALKKKDQYVKKNDRTTAIRASKSWENECKKELWPNEMPEPASSVERPDPSVEKEGSYATDR